MADMFADINSWAEAVALLSVNKVKEKVINDLTTKANECIDKFYADPVFNYNGSATNKPQYYVRTHNLYNAVHRYTNTHRGEYEFGIIFDSDRMHDNYYEDEASVMFQTLGKGAHGLASLSSTPKSSPSVFEELERYNKTELENKMDAYIDQAINEAIDEIGVI